VALTKAEVNERFYNTVGGEIVFETEAQGYLHPFAVAKLLAAQARERGTRELKLLELAGFLAGPWAYLRDRRRAARAAP
jgi:hypothetical protein